MDIVITKSVCHKRFLIYSNEYYVLKTFRDVLHDTDYNMSRLSYFQSLALLEKDVDIKLAVLNVLQHFSKGSGKYIHVHA